MHDEGNQQIHLITILKKPILYIKKYNHDKNWNVLIDKQCHMTKMDLETDKFLIRGYVKKLKAGSKG